MPNHTQRYFGCSLVTRIGSSGGKHTKHWCVLLFFFCCSPLKRHHMWLVWHICAKPCSSPMLVLSLHFMVKSWKTWQQAETTTTTITTPSVLGSMSSKLCCVVDMFFRLSFWKSTGWKPRFGDTLWLCAKGPITELSFLALWLKSGSAAAVWEQGMNAVGGDFSMDTRPKSLIFRCLCVVPSVAWDLGFALERALKCFIHYSVKSNYYDNQVIFLWRHEG